MRISWGHQVVATLFVLQAQAGPVDPSRHWPLPPTVLETRLAQDRLEILESRGDVGGVMGVKKLKVRQLLEDPLPEPPPSHAPLT